MHTRQGSTKPWGAPAHGGGARLRPGTLGAAVLACLVLAGHPAASQSNPQSVRGMDSLLAHAASASNAGDWPRAQVAWQQVVGANPFIARGWYQLGVASRNEGDAVAAARAFSRYVELGGSAPTERTVFGPDSPAEVAYTVASLHAAASRPDSAIDWLRKAFALGLRNRLRLAEDSTFRSLRADPRFRTLTGPEPATTREAGRRADLEFLREEVRRVDVRRSAQEHAAFEAAVERLLQEAAVLTENQFVMRMQGALALLGDGHTTFLPEGIPGWTRTLPLLFETFADGVYVVAADSAYAGLVGARILAIGGQPIAEALEMLDLIASRDNGMTLLRNRARNLRLPQALNGLGLAASDTAVSFRVRTARGDEREVTIQARTTPADYHRLAGSSAWVWVDAGSAAAQPLARRDMRAPYWFTYLPESRTVYLAFNSVVNTRTDTLARFAERLLRFVDSTAAERLVVDLRANNGGNSLLLLPLTDGIAASRVNRPGRLYVLIGRYTYSAGMNAATLLERHTAATFVGEPTPSDPNFVGESNVFTLPSTRVPVSVSDVYWQTSWPFDRRPWIAPRLYVPPTLEALRNRGDPALEAILQAPIPPAR